MDQHAFSLNNTFDLPFLELHDRLYAAYPENSHLRIALDVYHRQYANRSVPTRWAHIFDQAIIGGEVDLTPDIITHKTIDRIAELHMFQKICLRDMYDDLPEEQQQTFWLAMQTLAKNAALIRLVPQRCEQQLMDMAHSIIRTHNLSATTGAFDLQSVIMSAMRSGSVNSDVFADVIQDLESMNRKSMLGGISTILGTDGMPMQTIEELEELVPR